jgi:hypothetical protein
MDQVLGSIPTTPMVARQITLRDVLKVAASVYTLDKLDLAENTIVIFYPTFLENTGTARPDKQILDGESLMPLLRKDGALKRDAIFWHYPHYSNQGGLPAGAIRRGDYKLIEKYQDSSVELYDVVKDFGEQHDLSDALPARATAMKKHLRGWLGSVGAKVPGPNPNHDPTKPIYRRPRRLGAS